MTVLASLGDGMVPQLLPIERRVQESADVVTLELSVPSAWTFQPGQFDMLYVPGHGEVAISISGDPEQPSRLVHTVRAVGPTTRALARLAVGDELGVRGPYGKPWPEPPIGADVVVIAGGIGLAPLRPVIHRAIARQQRLFIVYGARTPADLLFGGQLKSWAQDHVCIVTVDRGDPGWSGNTGVVTKYVDQLGCDAGRTWAYVCGPEVMMRFGARTLRALGVPQSQVFVSLERNMRCGIGVCGHCQLGPHLLCKTGPVLPWPEAEPLLRIVEL